MVPPVEIIKEVYETMKKLVHSIWSYRLIRWAVALSFLIAGINKLFDPRSFMVVINDFGILPEVLSYPTAIFIPIIEIIAAILLILDRKGGLSLISGMLVFFILLLSYAIWLGLDIDCGCFGASDPEFQVYSSLHTSLYRDIVILSGIVYLYVWRNYNKKNPFYISLL